MFYALSKLLDLAFEPLAWAIALLLLSAPWRKRPFRRAKWRRFAPVLAIVVLYIFSIEPVSNRLLRHLEQDAPRTMRAGTVYDAVILLGGLTDEDATAAAGEPALDDAVERMLTTLDVLKTGKAKVAIISGGSAGLIPPDRAEADIVADELVSLGLARDRIVVEPHARNTRENAVYSAEIVRARGYRDVLVVTSAFHMKRALGCFRAVGLAVDTLPTDYRTYDPARYSGSLFPRAEFLKRSSSALREMSGRAVYEARGYTTN